MLEIMKKRMVTTRKDHECFACTERIEKGKQAVYATAKQDEQPIRFHLHQDCNIQLVKNKGALSNGVYYGCINDIKPAPLWLEG